MHSAIKEFSDVLLSDSRQPELFKGRQYRRLPSKTEPLVGRANDCEELVSIMADSASQSILLCSPPGFGKTSVVVEAAHTFLSKGHTVLYINSQGVHSADDLAHEITEALEPESLPTNKPSKRALGCLRSMPDDTVLILENFDNMVHPEREKLDAFFPTCEKKSESSAARNILGRTVSPLSTASFQTGKESVRSAADTRDELLKFINEIGQRAPNVKLLITSREEFDFVSFPFKVINLNPLSFEESVELLRRLDPSLAVSMAEGLAKQCDGIPLTLCIVASLLRNKSAETLIDRLKSSSPCSLVKDLSPENAPADSRIGHNLNVCFERLTWDERMLLVKLAVFPDKFTFDEVQIITKSIPTSQLYSNLSSLMRSCFLCRDQRSHYHLHPTIRMFCRAHTQLSEALRKEHDDAREHFLRYCSKNLSRMDGEFFSKKVKSSIENYRKQRQNIKQMLTWCAQDSYLDQEVRDQIIDAAIEVAVFLAQVMRREEFEDIFTGMAYQYRHDSVRYSQCLTYVGMKIMQSCTCSPSPCATALNRALSFLEEANVQQEARCVEYGPARAQCLSKLGQCRARLGRNEEGLSMINQALSIRGKLCEDEGVKARVMRAACFDDLSGIFIFFITHVLLVFNYVSIIIIVIEIFIHDK